jgi:beta-lactam-binding protein with PASTA domain
MRKIQICCCLGNIADHGLILGDITELPSDVVPSGNVIDQQPLASQIVDAGTIVSVTISSGVSTN